MKIQRCRKRRTDIGPEDGFLDGSSSGTPPSHRECSARESCIRRPDRENRNLSGIRAESWCRPCIIQTGPQGAFSALFLSGPEPYGSARARSQKRRHRLKNTSRFSRIPERVLSRASLPAVQNEKALLQEKNPGQNTRKPAATVPQAAKACASRPLPQNRKSGHRYPPRSKLPSPETSRHNRSLYSRSPAAWRPPARRCAGYR